MKTSCRICPRYNHQPSFLENPADSRPWHDPTGEPMLSRLDYHADSRPAMLSNRQGACMDFGISSLPKFYLTCDAVVALPAMLSTFSSLDIAMIPLESPWPGSLDIACSPDLPCRPFDPDHAIMQSDRPERQTSSMHEPQAPAPAPAPKARSCHDAEQPQASR